MNITINNNYIIHFYGTWCKSCLKFIIIFKQLSEKYKTIQFLNINVDNNQKVWKNLYNLEVYPTILYKLSSSSSSSSSSSTSSPQLPLLSSSSSPSSSSLKRYIGHRSYDMISLFIDRMISNESYKLIATNLYDDLIHYSTLTDNVTFVLSYSSTSSSSSSTRHNNYLRKQSIINIFKQLAEEMKDFVTFAINDKYQDDDANNHYEDNDDNLIVIYKYEVTHNYSNVKMIIDVNDGIYHINYDNNDDIATNINNNQLSSASLLMIKKNIQYFIQQNNYPLISIYDNHNFQRLSNLENRYIVILIIDYHHKNMVSVTTTTVANSSSSSNNNIDNNVSTIATTTKTTISTATSSISYINEYKDFILRISNHHHHHHDKNDDDQDKFIFGILDGKKFRGFIKTYHTLMPAILIINHEKQINYNFPLLPILPSSSSQSTSFLSLSLFTSSLATLRRVKNTKLQNNIIITNDIPSILTTIINHTQQIPFYSSVSPNVWKHILYRYDELYPMSLLIFIIPIIFFIICYYNPYPTEKKMKID
jgi:thiol-disulfide isomerase/thioredoxin